MRTTRKIEHFYDVLTALPRASDAPTATAVMRAHPADFRVEEQLGFELDGEGGHICFLLEKTQLSTQQALDQIRQKTHVNARDIGYCGLKDKHAITRQWISVKTEGQDWIKDLDDFGQGLAIVRQVRHNTKLRIGCHQGNTFRIVLRSFKGDADEFTTRFKHLITHGFPNYFAEQRFGHGAQNIARGLKLLTHELQCSQDQDIAINASKRRKKLSSRERRLRSLYISACRSFLFNWILGSRIQEGHWLTPKADERFILDGSNSFFESALDDEILSRLATHDIHTSGALWGVGKAITDWERACIEPYADLAQLLETAGLKATRRALRATVQSAASEWHSDSRVDLRFTLPRGSYATSLLRELCCYQNKALSL